MCLFHPYPQLWVGLELNILGSEECLHVEARRKTLPREISRIQQMAKVGVGCNFCLHGNKCDQNFSVDI